MSSGFATIQRLVRNTISMNPHKLPQIIERHYLKDMPRKGENSNLIQANELRFPLPYGQLAAKEWGNPNGLPVLAVHGWLDNSSSFDPLIPHILKPHDLHIVAIDEPGVGLSSHKPPGSEYGRWNTVMEMKRVIDHLKWSKCSLLGHSQGGHYVLLFAAMYPELVERVVCIDIFKPLTYHGDNWSKKVPKIVDIHMKYESFLSEDPKNSKAPVYSEADALKRMMEAHGNSLTEETARILMVRGTKKMEWGLTFSRDIRLKVPSLDPPPTDEQMLKFIANIRSDLLVIRAKQGPYHVPDQVRQKYYDIYQKNCRIFKDVYMDGSHHLHMNNPETVGPVINDFFSESIRSNFKPNL